MFTIELHKLNFFAHHGIHDEEAITGTDFEVDASIGFEPGEKITSLKHTINNVNVYTVIEKHMKQPEALLESLAENMAEDIRKLDDRIHTINISIKKLHPPVKNFTGSVGVTYTKTY